MAKRTLLDLIKSAVEELPIEQKFLTALKSVVMAENKPRPRSPHYKPSSLNCSRLMYFDLTQATMDTTVEDYSGTRICETGSMSHESIQHYCTLLKNYDSGFEYYDVEQYIKEKGLDYLQIKSKTAYETKLFDTRYNISFLCDGILKYTNSLGKIYWFILEIKTESERTGLDRNSANPKHRRQSVSYSLSLGINDIIWLYEERNFCVPKTFRTTVTDEERQELVHLFEYVDECVRQCTPPEKQPNSECTYCCYKKVCRSI